MDKVSANQKIIIQAVCVLLSIGLWFYVTNIESPTITYDLNKVPVELTNVDVLEDLDLALVPNQSFYVNLKIEGPTQDIFKVNRSDFKIILDLSEYALKVGENRIPINIIDFPSKLSIKNNSGLTVMVSTEERIKKEIAVSSNISIVSKPGYYVAEPLFEPQTVIVSGPESLVDRVDSVLAEGIEDNISDTTVKTYYLKCVDENKNIIEGVDISQKTVVATIAVNEGKSVPIKVKTTGSLKTGVKLKSIESTMTHVGLSGSKEVLDTIHEIETETIDLSNIEAYTEIDVNLIIPNDVQIYQGEKITTVKITIDKMESKEVTVNFNLINVPTGIRVVPSIKEINVKVNGYKEDIDEITADSIKADLDLAEFSEEGTFKKVPTVSLVDENLPVTIEPSSEITFEVVKEEVTSTDEE